MSVTVLVCVWVAACLVLVTGARMPNFVGQDDLPDGMHEVRVHYNGVTARQASVNPDQGSESGLVIRQVARHHSPLVTLVYVGVAEGAQPLSLRTCRVSAEPQDITEFYEQFENDIELAKTTPTGEWSGAMVNVTFAHLDAGHPLPHHLKPLAHYRSLKAQCKKHQREVRQATKAQRRLEKQKEQEQEQQSLSRRRRWILQEFFILPGTKWCGNSDLASSYNDLAGHVGADSCCRKHDLCPLSIGGFKQKYGIYNHAPTTISHCICDERFKACLKMTSTPAADLVGDVFFNRMKTKCFSLERKRTCTKWAGWFGPCQKYAVKQVAVMRNNVAYEL